jgi:hypothetical protein
MIMRGMDEWMDGWTEGGEIRHSPRGIAPLLSPEEEADTPTFHIPNLLEVPRNQARLPGFCTSCPLLLYQHAVIVRQGDCVRE